jgi:alpha-D-ribose 1-methylphosphonate 5-triphosphate synthase subunit PhnG
MYRHLMLEGDPAPAAPLHTERQVWLGVLAHAERAELERCWNAIDAPPRFEVLRPPEIGLAMVRGRAGGTGAAFNLGEMTVTRCAVRLEGGPVGFGYVAGRDVRKAELVARFDALLQTVDRGPALRRALIPALAAKRQQARDARAAKVASSRVDFFTMVRGEG